MKANSILNIDTRIKRVCTNMKAIILNGGQGGRFWPLISEEKPKQFSILYSNETMIQQTYQRFRNWLSADKVFVVTTENYFGT